MNNRKLKDWPEGPRLIEPLTEDDREDDLAPGRGFANGLLLGSVFWVVVIVAALLLLPAWSWGLI